MPAGNPLGYIKKAKSAASRIAKGTSVGRSSGAAASGRLSRVQGYVMKNKGKSAAMGIGGAMGVGAVTRRRTSGLDKTRGRATGMYKY